VPNDDRHGQLRRSRPAGTRGCRGDDHAHPARGARSAQRRASRKQSAGCPAGSAQNRFGLGSPGDRHLEGRTFYGSDTRKVGYDFSQRINGRESMTIKRRSSQPAAARIARCPERPRQRWPGGPTRTVSGAHDIEHLPRPRHAVGRVDQSRGSREGPTDRSADNGDSLPAGIGARPAGHDAVTNNTVRMSPQLHVTT